MHGIVALLAQAAEASDKKDLYPKLSELIVAAVAFAVLFAFMSKWVFPKVNQLLEERRAKIQGDLEKAEESKTEASQMLQEYRQQLAGAREDANRIIEDARQNAETMRRDLMAKAEQERQAAVARAQEEIRAERDRVLQELKVQVGELSLALASRMVGESLDRDRHLHLVDEYISELGAITPAGKGNGNGNGHGGGEKG